MKKYNIYDNGQTRTILQENVHFFELNDLMSVYEDIGYSQLLVEEASDGSTSASEIASNPYSAQKNRSLLIDLMSTFYNKIQNKPRNFIITLKEDFDMRSVFSRLASLEKSGSTDKKSTTTFGIEDDNGNIMKISVRSDQAEDFERDVAQMLSDIKTASHTIPNSKETKELSMAELLFNLKDKFDIVDVEFPQIPSDVIYNADKASPKNDIKNNTINSDETTNSDNTNNDSTNFSDDMSEPLDLSNAIDDGEAKIDTDTNLKTVMDDELKDADSVSNFEEPIDNSNNSESSLLTQVIDMIKAQAQAEIEKSKADAEKARADQARYTAQATSQELQSQEDLLRYDLEMEEAKKREKEAKKLADMAKYKMTKTMSAASPMREFVETSSPEAVLKEKLSIVAQYKIMPNDSQETIKFKNMQKQEALRAWTARYRMALNAKKYSMVMQNNQQQNNQQQNNQQQNNQQQNNQQQNNGGSI